MGLRFRETIAIVKWHRTSIALFGQVAYIFLKCLMNRKGILYAELTIAKNDMKEITVI
jgi:hypothetical protein